MDQMQIIKESCGQTVILRVLQYNPTLGNLDKLYKEAMKDFPEITRETVKVRVYGGERFKGTYGIEFGVLSAIPRSYVSVGQRELILG